jgi:phosphopantetheinyl transferase
MRYARSGRLALAARPDGHDWRFSLSHTRDMCACIVSVGVDVGVDVESAHGHDVLRLAARFFTREEYEELRAITGAARRHERFRALWTLKEAYAKSRRTVLPAVIGTCSFHIGEQPDAIRLRRASGEWDESDQHCRFTLAEVSPTTTLAAAVVAVRGDVQFRLHDCVL